MSDLDDLERELGPTLRASLQRAAAHVTASTDAPSTEGELMNYLKTPVEHDSPSDVHGGRGRKGGLITVAVLAAAAAVVAAIALVRSAQDDDAPANEPVTTPVTTLPAEDASAVIPPDTPYFLDLATGQPTALPESIVKPDVFSYVASPDGTRLMFGTCCTEEDVVTIANVDGSDVEALASTEGLGRNGGGWSPDGTRIVYQERDSTGQDLGELVVHDVTTDERTTVVDLGTEENGSWFLGPRFSPDGQRVIYHRPHGTDPDTRWDAWSVPVTGGEPTLLLEDALFPIYFPDGEELAIVTPTSNLNGDSIVIVGADGGSRRTLVDEIVSIFYPTMSPDGTRLAYVDVGAIYVVDVATGDTTKVADRGRSAEWLDDDTLIVQP